MKTGKKEDRLFFIIQSVSFLPLYNDLFFRYIDVPPGFFLEPERQRQNVTINTIWGVDQSSFDPIFPEFGK